MSKNYLQSYFNEISKYPLLSEKEEKELLLKLKEGDISARDKLITSNMKLVFKIANDFKNHGVSIDDLVQVGSIGLMEAIDKFNFDESKNARLATYAQWWIKCRIKREFKNSRVISFDNNIYTKMNLAQELKDKYGDNGETAGMVAKEINSSRIKYAKNLMDGYSQFSLNEKINDENVHEIIENITDDSHDLINTINSKEVIDFILKNYKNYLTPVEQIIFEKRFIYEFLGNDKMNQEELARELGYSRQMVGVIEKKICNKFKKVKCLMFS